MRLYTHHRSQASFCVGTAINLEAPERDGTLPSLERGDQLAAE